MRTDKRPLLFSTAVLLLMFGLALTSMTQLGPTFDEQGFLVRGLGYIRGQNQHMRVGHPLGLNALNALPLKNDTAVQLPISDPSWQETGFHRPAELFLWEIGNNVEHLMFLARLPTIWLGLLLAALVGRWAGKMSRSQWAGALALTLIALDPNVLANMRLTTTDLGLAVGAAVAGFTLWSFLRRPSWTNALIAGAGFGLLQNTKFTAGLFVPLFALVILVGLLVQWRSNRANFQNTTNLIPQFPWKTLLMLLTAYPLAAFFILWAAYGFQIGTLPHELPTLSQLAGLTIPLSHHIEQLLDIGGRLQVETPSFLLGQHSSTGWWYYFPVAFLLKTPLPILILLVMACVLRILYYVNTVQTQAIRNTLLNDAALLIPALGYFAIALTSEINLGYRHLLPILPFFAVFIANSMGTFQPLKKEKRLRNTAVALTLLLLGISLWVYPHYLSYFNVIAGGPNNGWRYLVDSNIDWGQDLNKLKGWLAENDVEQVWLSYFGEAQPDYYGINYIGLDSWPPRLMNPEARPFTPHKPAPGIYAISATNLQGVHFANHDQFAYFRERDPIAKIGYSLFLYEVPVEGGPVDVLLGDVQLDEIAPDDFQQFNSNDVTPRWFDPAQAIIIPDSNRRWLVLATDTAVSPIIQAFITDWPARVKADNYTLIQVPDLALPEVEPLTTFSLGEGEVELLNALVGTAVPGQALLISTGWQQNAPPQPFKMFIHMLNEEGNIVAQWDGLGVAWEGWRTEDILLHTHSISLPADLPAGQYQLRAGLYHPETNNRWLRDNGSDFATIWIGEVDE